MNQNRLTGMAFLSIEKSLVDQLLFDDVINDFFNNKSKKIETLIRY